MTTHPLPLRTTPDSLPLYGALNDTLPLLSPCSGHTWAVAIARRPATTIVY